MLLAVFAVQAQPVSRVTNQVYGYYQGTIEFSSTVLNGQQTEYYGSDYKFTQYNSVGGVQTPAAFTGSWDPGAAIYGGQAALTTVVVNAYASTDFKQNKVSVAMSGFSPASNFPRTDTLCFTHPGTATCASPEFELLTNVTPSAYGQANSNWEDLYFLGGGTGGGSISATFHLDGTLGPGTTSPGNQGTVYFNWSQRDFLGNYNGYVQASYDTAGDHWYKTVYSGLNGGTTTLTDGAGMLTINEDVVVPIGFTFNQVAYVQSVAQIDVYGNAAGSFDHTITLQQLGLPTGARFFAASGADYGGVVTGGAVCPTQSCAIGGGGGVTPVPEPEAYAMMLAGLGLLSFVARRQKRQAV